MFRLSAIVIRIANGEWRDEVEFDGAIGHPHDQNGQVFAEPDDLSGVGGQKEHGRNRPRFDRDLGQGR